MPKKELLKKYAELAVKIGANVQKGQVLVVDSTLETKELARLIVKAGYDAGAKKVSMMWSDPYITRLNYKGMSVETLEDIPQWQIDRAKEYVDKDACIIVITSPIPGINTGVDPIKLQRSGLAQMKALKFAQDHMMGNHTQWNIVAAPNTVWAKKLFPELLEDEAMERLWDAILKASRVTEETDPIVEWEKHNKELLTHNQLLTEYQFKTIRFKNSIGTDLSIDLVRNHIWRGGIETTTKGIAFNPNIPTEENFTMPHKYGVNGKVVATKPMEYQGKLIDEFWLEFKDGKVINYDAKRELNSLENILSVDEGSARLGEVALLSFDSPINNTGILFLNTLFDENASCHLALGNSYKSNLQYGDKLTPKELDEIGSNQSMIHMDFMFGSSDMQIEGILEDGSIISIFERGNYII